MGSCALGGGAGGPGCGGRAWRQLARLPQIEHGAEVGENLRQGGQDEGVQGRDQPGLGGLVGSLRAHVRGDAGDLLGQGMG